MKLADSNVWLALVILDHPFHEAVRERFEALPRDRGLIFCRATQQSFLRLLTTKAVFAPSGYSPLSNRKAWQVYQDLAADNRISYSEEPPGIEKAWRELGSSETASPKIWMDAYLAAFAICGGHELLTTDAGYRKFARLELDLVEIAKR